MLVIGLTGGIACGKSTLSAMLADFGAPVADADAISRSLTAPGGTALPAVRDAFGDDVFRPDGTLDRAALGRRVFADARALAVLNGIIHPMVTRAIREKLEAWRAQGVPVCVLDVPLLFEAGMQELADITVCVAVDEGEQLRRIKARDGLSESDAVSRIRSQMPLPQKAALCDVVIRNDRPLDDVRRELEALYTGWCEAARKEDA